MLQSEHICFRQPVQLVSTWTPKLSMSISIESLSGTACKDWPQLSQFVGGYMEQSIAGEDAPDVVVDDAPEFVGSQKMCNGAPV
jgi:hypothetical protein